jgi:hypothetical protein
MVCPFSRLQCTLIWNPQGGESRKQPRTSKRIVKEDAVKVGKMWCEIISVAENGSRWWYVLDVLCASCLRAKGMNHGSQ